MKLTSLLVSLFAGTALVASAQETLSLKGSDTLGAEMMPLLADAFTAAGNDVKFEIAAEGSSAAFSSLLQGTAQIGMSSRDAKQDELDKFVAKGEKLVEHPIAVDMIAVIVNKENKLRDLSVEQIEGIFTGDITDWSQVGGAPGQIAIYTRNTASGTYKTFQKLGMNKRDYAASSQKLAGNQQIADAVASNPNGIGYVGLAFSKGDNHRSIKVGGVAPRPKNKSEYALARSLFLYTVGEPSGVAGEFIKWILESEKAAEVIEQVKYIPLDRPAA